MSCGVQRKVVHSYVFLFLKDERVSSKHICCWKDVQVGKMIKTLEKFK